MNIPAPAQWNIRFVEKNIAISTDIARDYTLPFVTLSGKTTDSNGVAVPNVGINIAKQWNHGNGYSSAQGGAIQSDANGDYSVVLLPYSNYPVTLSPSAASGFIQTMLNGVNVSTDTVVDLALADVSSLSGTIYGPDGTTPVVGANVRAYDPVSDKPAGSAGLTDSLGHYEITVPNGTYNIQLFGYGSEMNIPAPAQWNIRFVVTGHQAGLCHHSWV